jgi:hypothetical protein
VWPPAISQPPSVLLAAGGVFGGDPGRFLAVERFDRPGRPVILQGHRVVSGTALAGPAAEGCDTLQDWQ